MHTATDCWRTKAQKTTAVLPAQHVLLPPDLIRQHGEEEVGHTLEAGSSTIALVARVLPILQLLLCGQRLTADELLPAPRGRDPSAISEALKQRTLTLCRLCGQVHVVLAI
jgi:hypothetical protein